MSLQDEISDAIWRGDTAKLDELAHCKCCCAEHTFEECPARAWYGCRGQYIMTSEDHESWFRHYSRYHGFSREKFYGYGGTDA